MFQYCGNDFYDPRLVIKYLVFLLVLIAAMMATGGLASLLLLVLLLFYSVMRQPEKILFVVLLSSSLMMMNGTLAPKTTITVAALKAQVVIAAGILFAQIFGRRQSRMLSPMLAILPYIFFMIIPSYYGWCPRISFLKLFLFTAVFLAYFGCSVKAMEGHDKSVKYRSMIVAVAIFFIFGSLVVYPVPSISLMDYELAIRSEAPSFYQGVTNHSQTLGVLMAVLGVLLYADLVFNIQKRDRLYIALIICSAILIYMAASRTAMASLIAGIGFSTFIAMRAKGVKRTWRGKVVSCMFALVSIGAVAVLVVPQLREKTLNFALKYGTAVDLDVSKETFLATRQGKWDEAMENWRRSPYIGNGFQVTEEMQYKQINGWKDILSAPVEKSTWTTAILEEGGVVGMILFSLFLFHILFSCLRYRSYLGLSVFFAFLMCNFGEFSLFSMSMDGGIFWFLVFFGLILDHWRVQRAKMNERHFWR